jgi:predicted transcriptional regulator
VLTALAGRAPVAQVRRGQLRLGVIAIVVGLLVLSMAVAATRESTGSSTRAGTFLAMLAAATVVAGVCALTPIVVDRWGWLGTRSKGSTRLALRSLVRHRARSAAMVAAIAAIGAAGVAGASGVEAWSRFDDNGRFPTRLDVIRVMNLSSTYDSATGVETRTPQPVPQEWLDDIEQVVPGVVWHELQWVDLVTQGQVLLGTDATLAAIGVPAEQRDELFAGGDVVFAARSETYGGWCAGPDCGFGTDMLLVPDLAFTGVTLVQPDAVDRLGFTPGMSEQLGIAPADLTDAQREQLTVVSYASIYGAFFLDETVGDGEQVLLGGAGVQFEYPYVATVVTRDMARWVVLSAVLLLVALVVTIGLALWAAEGKVERDQLVAVGAGPRSLAGMAGVRAWVLATSGGVIAVPLGMSMLWVVVRAADATRTPFPTVAAVAIAIGLPLVVAGGAYVTSAFAQRVRPVTGATMSLD